MDEQMKSLRDGGIAAGSVDRDPISGNEIPPGSMAEEVRDDIPAQLSEGEYVVPADVVRFFGVKYFEDLRTEAKMGLQGMEADGRIGGEPVPMTGGESSEISEQDLVQLEQMLASGVANGGLMDKLAFAAKNDRVINQRLNAGGMVVGFAEGGEVTAPTASYADPNRVDSVINKVMAAVQQKPELLQELSKRGLQVSRTAPTMEAGEMDKANPMSETRKAFNEGGTATPDYENMAMNSSVGLPSWANTLGGSYTYQGPGVAGPKGFEPETPTATAESCATLGMDFDAELKMCVPKPVVQKSDNDDDDDPIVPPTGTGSSSWYEDVDWRDPAAILEYGQSSLTALNDFTKKGARIAGALVGGPMGLIGAAVPKIDAMMDLSKARAALLVARAKGDNETASKLATDIAAYEKGVGFDGKGIDDLIASGNMKFNSFTKSLGLDPVEYDPKRMDEWTDNQRKAYSDAIGSTDVVVAPVVPAPTTTGSGGGSRSSLMDKTMAAAHQSRIDATRKKEAASVAESESKSGLGADTAGGRTRTDTETGEKKETYSSKVARGGGFAKGGLMKKHKK
jgi:hypothetical protein